MIGSVHKQLAKDVAILKRVDGDFEDFVGALRQNKPDKWSHTKWLEVSGNMTEYTVV